MRRVRLIPVLFICLVCSGVCSLAQDFEQKLLAVMPAEHGEFGSSISLDGDIVIVGARLDDEQGIDAGAAYVFAREQGTWRLQSKLLPPAGIFDQQFGVSVAVDRRTAVIGAWRDQVNGLYSGSAYVFAPTASEWLQQAKLSSADGSPLDEFGRRVAVAGHTVAVAAGFDDDNGVDSGSVYVFVRRGKDWLEQAKLLAADGQPSDVFGSDIDVDGDTLIVGASLDDDLGDAAGSAYVFVRTGATWIQQAKLLPDDGSEDDRFGSSVVLDGDTALIGAPGDEDNGLRSGSAYVFVRTHGVWTQTAKLVPSDGDRNDEFGTSIGLSENAAVIGAPSDSDQLINAGSFYVFVNDGNGWMEQAKVFAPDGQFSDEFATAVSLGGSTIVSGSPNNRQGGPNAGAAYVFRIGEWRREGE